MTEILSLEIKILLATLLLFLGNLGMLALVVKLYTEFYKERVRVREK